MESLSKSKSKEEIENEKIEKESVEMREQFLQEYAKVWSCFVSLLSF
jgi:hypothetical protein